MELRQLRYFLAIANEGQVTRAAQLLNMAQPPLSQQLKSLEDELGVTLFERSARRMQLTQAGELLRERAESILQMVTETFTEVRELHEGVIGTLKIGAAPSCSSLLPRQIQSFRIAYPKVKYRIWEGDPKGLTQRLQKRDIDLAITRFPLETDYDPALFEIIRLKEEPFLAILPYSLDLDRRASSIRLNDLAKMPFILLQSEKSTGTHDIIVEECRRLGFQPNVICECSSITTILNMVNEGVGVTVLHEAIVSNIQFPISVKKLTATSISSEICLIFLKNRLLPKGAQLFIESFVDKELI
ncbi:MULTISPECIES: LysR family transcriptional regulator [unclassified Bacillus (in: firmicutes)]|uniref:LysR family transcriptional regulator n=1 Tax=unclassified Bacillus (in: firmicutes) TaxID=185979 RepID=UPI0023DB9E16|nr:MULTISPECIES: LysR family transcriptional regulator [unclassified Bacillus (in: firmicutes)]MCU4760100.1 LysR family transcriptional regulator [Bacillus cereus]MDF2018478.1 LysR family transcriptional regulator [Bacillus sp. Cr_R3]MDF2032944.1 LysR family transcriptional regulator [Bacillus sp. Cr_R16]